VRKIQVLKPVKFISIRRNEINAKQSKNPLIIEDRRAQRNSIILKDVSYIIEASVFQKETSKKNPPKKYKEMFKRRVKKGQCYRRPYLGTREFAAEFSDPNSLDKPLIETIPIGSMLFDIFYDEEGKPSPLFFYDVAVVDGVLNCEVEENDRLMESTHLLPEYDSKTNAVLYDFKHMEEVL
jgi:CRISPR-associated protein Cas5d